MPFQLLAITNCKNTIIFKARYSTGVSPVEYLEETGRPTRAKRAYHHSERPKGAETGCGRSSVDKFKKAPEKNSESAFPDFSIDNFLNYDTFAEEMSSINNIIWRYIAEDASIQKDLHRELINIRGLARYLIDKYHISASMDAVISAIRRYESECVFEDNTKAIDAVLHSAVITTKNHVSCITMKEHEFRTISSDFIGKNVLKENFRMVKSKEIIKLFLNQKDIEKKLEIFEKENILSVTKDLAEIRVTMHSKAAETVGVLARISHEIALHDVAIYELISAIPELLIYVKSDDLVRAHKAVLGLIKK